MTDPLALLIKIAKEKHVDKKWIDKPLYIIQIQAKEIWQKNLLWNIVKN